MEPSLEEKKYFEELFRQVLILKLEWMVEHFKWAHDQTGLGGSYSPQLQKAIETLERLKEERCRE